MNLMHYHSAPLLVFGMAGLKWLLAGLIIASSQLWKSKALAWPMGVGLATTAVGLVFQVEHWSFTVPLLLTGAGLVLVTYAYWFSRKKAKDLLSLLKLAGIMGFAGEIAAFALGSTVMQPAEAATETLFWLAASLFAFQRWIRPSVQRMR